MDDPDSRVRARASDLHDDSASPGRVVPAMQSGLFIWGPVAVAALVMVLMTVRTHSRRLPLAAIALYGWGIVTSIVVIASQRPG